MQFWAFGLAAVLVAGVATAQGDHYVRGYTKSDGTYVAPHYQTNPNGMSADNWSTQGNVNPYTGQPGREAPRPEYGRQPAPTYYTPQASPYGTPSNRGASSYNQPSTGSSFSPNFPEPR